MSLDPTSLGIVVRFAAGACAFYACWRLMLVRTINDEYRQQVFEYRRELFRMASEPGLSYADPAYVEARSLMNGFLRSGHELTFTRLVWYTIPKSEQPKYALEREERLRHLPEAVRNKLTLLQSNVYLATLKRALFSSLPALIFIGVFIGILLAVLSIPRILRREKDAVKETAVKIFKPGPIIEEVIAREGELAAA